MSGSRCSRLHDARAAALDVATQMPRWPPPTSEARRVGAARRAAARSKLGCAVRSHLTELALRRRRGSRSTVDGDVGRRGHLPVRRQPGRRPRAARPGRLRRRARPHDARVPPGRHRGAADARLRRGRRRHRRAGRARSGAIARLARSDAPGARRDPPRAGRRLRRRADRGRQARGEWAHDGQRVGGRSAMPARSSSRGCCRACRRAPPPAITPRSCSPTAARERGR